MKSYKEQKEKSKKLKNISQIPKSKKVTIKSKDRTNNFVFHNSNITLEMKEEPTRNLRDELKKSTSNSKNSYQNNAVPEKQSLKKDQSVLFQSAKSLKNSNLLNEINEKKKLIQLNLNKCHNSIEEKRKV